MVAFFVSVHDFGPSGKPALTTGVLLDFFVTVLEDLESFKLEADDCLLGIDELDFLSRWESELLRVVMSSTHKTKNELN